MALKLSNNAYGLLALAISDSDTSLTLDAGHGSRFPALGSGDWFPITVVRASDPTQLEIMRCTARTLDTLTVERAQEGTSALAFDPGDVVELRLTSGKLEENFPQVEGRNAKNLSFSIDIVGGKPRLKFKSGDDEETVVRSSDLGTAATHNVNASGLPLFAGFNPDRRHAILPNSEYNDCNSITFNSLYNCQGAVTLNSPTNDWFFLHTMVHGVSDAWVTQVAYGMTVGEVWLRLRGSGIWTAWSYIGGERVVLNSRTISTGTGLTGGGDLSANRTISLATSHYPIGMGQTWQNVTEQRAWATTYTNTTGRPIAVYIHTVHVGGGVSISMNIGGVIFYGPSIGVDGSASIFAIIPPGVNYSAISNHDLSQWLELR